MPVVPKPSGPSVGSTISQANFSNPISGEAASLPGRQLEAQGDAMQRAGSQATNLFVQAQQEANAVRVSDAQNRYMQQQNEMTSNPNGTGYQNKKGLEALPPDKPLSEIYGQQLSKVADDLSQGFGNDAQRRMFSEWAAAQHTSFVGQVDAHSAREFQTYRDSTDDATISVGQNTIVTQYADAQKVSDAVDAIHGAWANKARISGLAPIYADTQAKDAVSKTLTDVAKGLLDNGDLTAANAFSEKYKEEIGPRILDLQIAIKGQQELGLAQAAVSSAAAVGLPQMAPTDFDRVLNITATAESGGRETDSQGRTITSSAGAQGVMQVMPTTNKDPGFGVKPAANDTPAERARVGRDYMQAMITRYSGDVSKAWAAYNAGPGRFDAVLEKYGNDWLAHVPKETHDYVVNNTAAYASGSGKPASMTEAEFVNNAVATVQKTQPNASPTLIAKTQQLATQQYGILKSSIAEKQTAAYNDALTGLIQNGGDFYALPPTVRANIPPDKVDSAMTFAKSLSAGPTKSNEAVYYSLSTNNDYLAKMTDQQFYAMRTELSDSDFKHFTDERAKLRDPTKPVSGKDPGNINREAINSTLSDRLRQININPSPNAKDTEATQRVGAIHKYVTDSLVAAQQQAGHMYSDAEVSDHIDKLFSKNVTFRNEFFGQTTGRTNRQLLGVKYNEIPYQDKDRIIAAFKARGNPNPSQGDILGAYLAHPIAGK